MASLNPKTDICIAVAGEALVDLISRPDGSYLPFMGGAPYNLARALARQGVGTGYLNPLSVDRFGRALAHQLQQDGVHLAHEVPVVQTTSLAVVGLNGSGHPDYAFYREGVADRQVTAAGLGMVCGLYTGMQIVCTGALALDPCDAGVYLPWLRAQRDAGHLVVVDANLRPSAIPDLASYRSHVLAALALANVIKVSDEDLVHLGWSGVDSIDAARALLQSSGASMVALTLGASGAWLLTPDGQWHAQEKEGLSVVDTVGAGDCFLAGLLAALLDVQAQNGTPKSALRELGGPGYRGLLRHALASASLCVQQQGCAPPSWQQVVEWADTHPALSLA